MNVIFAHSEFRLFLQSQRQTLVKKESEGILWDPGNPEN